MCDVTDLIAFNGVLLILLCIYTQSSTENWLIYRLKSYFLHVRRTKHRTGENHKNNRIYASVFHTNKHTTKNCYLFYFFTARVRLYVFRGNLFSPTKWKTAEKQRIESSTHLMYRDSLTDVYGRRTGYCVMW